jgi:hypothetical protein
MKNLPVIIISLLSMGYFYPIELLSHTYQYINTESCNAVSFIDSLDMETEHHPIIDPCHWHGPVSDYNISLLEAGGYEFSFIDPINADSKNDDLKAKAQIFNGFIYGDYAGHFYYDEILKKTEAYLKEIAFLKDMTYSIDTIGFTRNSEPIIAYHLSSGNPENPNALITSLMHAREAITATTVLYYLYEMERRAELTTDIHDWLFDINYTFIPVYNPDGYILNQENDPDGGGLIRKNVYYENDRYIGTDLNRNFGPDSLWQKASTNKTGESYRGDTPFSEPETRAVDSLTSAIDYDLQMHLHSFGNVVVKPQDGYSSEHIEHVHYAEGSELLRRIGYSCGQNYESLNYQTYGDIANYMTLKNPESIVVLPELGNQIEGFWPTEWQFHGILFEGYVIITEYLELLHGKFVLENIRENSEMVDQQSLLDYQMNLEGVYHSSINTSYPSILQWNNGFLSSYQEDIDTEMTEHIYTYRNGFDSNLNIREDIYYEFSRKSTNGLYDYHNGYSDILIGNTFKITPDSIVEIRDNLTVNTFKGDSVYIPSEKTKSVFRVYFELPSDAFSAVYDYRLMFSADWRTRTRLDMVTISVPMGSLKYNIETPYTIDGIYPQELQGFSQKVGMHGFHSVMVKPKSQSVELYLDQFQPYIEVEYHAESPGISEEFYFNMFDIVLDAVWHEPNISVEEFKSNISELKDDFDIYNITGSLVKLSSKKSTLSYLAVNLPNGIYIAKGSSYSYMIQITEGRIVAYRELD